MELPTTIILKEIKKENKNSKTLFFDYKTKFQPGQFVMLWLPGIDEKPFTLSYHSKNKIGISVEKKGKFTKKIFKLKPGAKLGIRGPYGHGYKIKSKTNCCIIGGGLGMAPLATLAERLNKPDIIIGAKSKKQLLFADRFPKAKITTDDGSCGRKCFTTELFEELLKQKKYKMVYCCGPEIMIKTVIDLCEKNKIPCQASLERYMKCGLGICGSCAINGKLVCKDGPVFTGKEIKAMTDFGNFALDASGKKVSLKKYYS